MGGLPTDWTVLIFRRSLSGAKGVWESISWKRSMIPCIILVLIDCGEVNADGTLLQHVKIDMVF
jgi:hypothetical protein